MASLCPVVSLHYKYLFQLNGHIYTVLSLMYGNGQKCTAFLKARVAAIFKPEFYAQFLQSLMIHTFRQVCRVHKGA